jgi:hypothetical protein
MKNEKLYIIIILLMFPSLRDKIVLRNNFSRGERDYVASGRKGLNSHREKGIIFPF